MHAEINVAFTRSPKIVEFSVDHDAEGIKRLRGVLNTNLKLIDWIDTMKTKIKNSMY